MNAGDNPPTQATDSVSKLATALSARLYKLDTPTPPKADDPKEGTLKEYAAIRDEIRGTETSIITVINFMVAATAVVMGQGITNSAPGVFVIPMWLMIITSFYVADKRWVIWTLAIYQRARVESKGYGLLWESTLADFRDRCAKKGPESKGLFIPAVNIMYIEFLMVVTIVVLNASLFCWYFEQKLHADSIKAGCPVPGRWFTNRVEYLAPLVSGLLAWWIARRHYQQLKKHGGSDSSLYKMFRDSVAAVEQRQAEAATAPTDPDATPPPPTTPGTL